MKFLRLIPLICFLLTLVSPELSAGANSDPVKRIYELANGKTAKLEKYILSISDEKDRASYINTPNKNGSTALLRALEYFMADNVAVLILYGADVNKAAYLPSKNASKNFGVKRTSFPGVYVPPAHDRAKQASVGAVAGAAGRDIFMSVQFSPISFLSRCREKQPDNDLELKILELLLKSGADPNTPDPISGWSPLMNYIDRGFESAIRLLLKQENIDLGFTAKDGKSVESLAQIHKREPTGKIVLQAIRKKAAEPKKDVPAKEKGAPAE